MNWYAQYRQAWIAEMLKVYGFINRHHLQRKFGVSEATAATDFREFNAANPGAMLYCPARKHYHLPGFEEEAAPVDPNQLDIIDYLKTGSAAQ